MKRQDFHSVAWVMPQGPGPRGGTWGVPWGVVKIQGHNFFGVPAPCGLWEGPKGQISLNLNYKVNFKDFYVSPGSCPRVWDLGVLGGQKFNFLNMVMWHIKLKGMSSRP